MERVTSQELIRWSEALAGVARTGLGFTQSLYERERFEEILAIARQVGGDEVDVTAFVKGMYDQMLGRT